MTTFTGTGIEIYRLTVAKSAIAMERDGFKVSRMSWRAQMCRELGLKRNTHHNEVILIIERRIAELLANAEPGAITP